MPEISLHARQRRTLDALCRRVVPAAYATPDEDGVPLDVAAAVERRLAEGDPVLARQMATLLSAFDSPVTALLTTGAPRRFSRRSADAQDALLRRWESSSVGAQRTVFQAFRRLILSTYYAHPEATRATGARPPLHGRAPAVSWEGPLPGLPTDDEPVLRTRDPGRPDAPTRAPLPAGVVSGAELAGGAVGTPSILLRRGLGGPAIGRYLRLHPTTALIGAYDREMHGAAGIPLSTVCDEFQHGDDGYGFWVEVPPLYPAIAAVAQPGSGAAHRARMRTFPYLGAMIVLVRDGADRDVSNGEVRVDRRGRPVLCYALGDADARTMRRGLAATARLHLAAGAREVTALHTREHRVRSEAELGIFDALECGANRLTLLSAHVNGTCLLGVDARRSTCTPDGAVRGAPGVYVCDGSVLPTALGVNPQETIMAVATVLAERIAARHAPG